MEMNINEYLRNGNENINEYLGNGNEYKWIFR